MSCTFYFYHGIKESDNIMGIQCHQCNKLKDGKCTRIGKGNRLGVCWMATGEGEYDYGEKDIPTKQLFVLKDGTIIYI